MTSRGYLWAGAALGAVCIVGIAACSSDTGGGTLPQGGTGGSASGGSGGTGLGGSSAGTFTGAGTGGSGVAGTGGSGITAGTGGGAVGGGGSGSGGAGGSGGSGGAQGGTGGSGGAPSGTPPTCKTETPSPNGAKPIECDYLLQSIDFEDMHSYASPPASIKVTTFGSAFGQFAINKCSPYCYAKNLTVGVDIVGGADATTKGEIIAEFPATGNGLPITMADANRNILAWITFDGEKKPDFEIDTQLVLETATGVVPSVEVKQYFKPGGNAPFGPFSDQSYQQGSEFKYFSAVGNNGFPTAPANVTGIGFRIVAKATAGQSWHGVAYIDHLQVRAPSPNNPQGNYPFGLQ
jgi:hypothetical protein